MINQTFTSISDPIVTWTAAEVDLAFGGAE